MFTDEDAAMLYDLLNPWDGGRFPSDAFYDELVGSAQAVLDVGCGPGSMLCQARASGHRGRLVGLDPDPARLVRAAAKRTDVEWVRGVAAQAELDQEFDLATMVSHTFQLLVSDEELQASLVAIRRALVVGGQFAFETRHPQAREWLEWTPQDPSDVIDETGRALRMAHQFESMDGDLVTFSETTIDWDLGEVLRIDRFTLRFLDAPALDDRLAAAGFEIEARYGDWDRSALTDTSREIITIARRR